MKKNILKNSIITGVLCAVIIVPTFAQSTDIMPVSAKSDESVSIRHEVDHWSEKYINQLSKNYNVDLLFEDKDLNDSITIEDFKNIVKLTIDKEYDNSTDSITREAIVYEITRIWAKETDKNLEKIPVIKMLIYPDTNKINSKYNHGITVAYMHDIAKGRDTGVFDPKAEVTYGELATLIYNTDKAIKTELNSDDQSIVKGKLETKGSYEITDDKVILNFELMSHYAETKELKFSSGQQFEIVIMDENDKEVYRYSDGKAFTEALVFKTIKPGELLKWNDEWDLTNKEGNKLTEGEYKAEIKILVMEEDKGAIEEEELTTIIDFSL